VKYRFTGSHPEDLSSGRVISPGEETSDVDPEKEPDSRLIAEEKLLPLGEQKGDDTEGAKSPPAKSQSGKQKEDDK
jgi:hypothetical protein